MKLRQVFQTLALKLQEQADELSNSDVCRWLSAAVQDLEGYCYYCDHFGDGESGDVIYSCRGEMKKAPYTFGTVNGKRAATIDDDNAVCVMPVTSYEPTADDDDHMASMEARGRSLVEAGLYTELPVYERKISKAERDAADPGSFAGKGKSFPILKPGDVQAAVHAMGRAGASNHSTATLKKNIISIAKKKGFTSQLPDSWKGEDSSSEAAAVDVALTGDFVALKEGAVGQDGSALLKLIAPGWGSCGYYPPEVLERDGPRVFPKGTKNFWNHQTEAEEAARPEGDLRDLASVLVEDAHYEAKGPDGAGLYARAEVQPTFRGPVDSLAKHIGMSIRASGKAREGEVGGKKGRIIEKLERGHSVDYVTTPGAGGKVLQLFEAARGRQHSTEIEGDDMDVKEALAKIRKTNERLALREAKDYAAEKIGSERLNDATKRRLIERVILAAPLDDEGNLDTKKFDEIIAREVKDEATYLAEITGGRLVTGMGSGASIRESDDGLSKKERKRLRKMREASDENFEEGMKEVGAAFGLSKEGRKLFAVGRSEEVA